MQRINHDSCPICKSTQLNQLMNVVDHSVTKETFPLFTCDNCGFILTQNAPDEKNIGPYYHFEEYISHTDTKEGIVNKLYHFARDFMLSKKQSLIAKYKKSGTLLDIGTGTGYFINHMKKKNWDVQAVEQEESARKFCQDNFGIKVDEPDTLAKLENKSFDVVTMWHVLEHVHEMDTYIKTISEVIKDDGLVVIALPNPGSTDAKHYGEFWAAFDVPRHLWHFTEGSLGLLLKKYGMEIFTTKRMPLDAFYVSMLSEKHKKSSLSFLRGMFWGKISWFISLFNKKACSSLIYLVKKV